MPSFIVSPMYSRYCLPFLCFFTPILALQTTNTGTGIDFTNNDGRLALLWSSIGLAVLTSLLQGLVTTIVTIAEDQAMWTFRFRIARLEHWWWTIIAICLSTSFGLIVLSFLAGNNNDSLGVLALSTATAIAIVRYAIPSWRNRHFIESRWLAWTGSSRTGIQYRYAIICGDAKHWQTLHRQSHTRQAPPPSDDWGLAMNPPPGIPADPTAILNGFGEISSDLHFSKSWPIGPCVYDDGMHGGNQSGNISLLWGEREGFRRRVSRGINSMPAGLLQSRPFTVDQYNGEGLCLALGILGRIKGLVPSQLIFDHDDSWKKRHGIRRKNALGPVTATLESTSIWSPRPNKVMRSYYEHAMKEQFGTLPASFIGAATELALVLLDCRPRTVRDWLTQGLEQQSMEVNINMSRPNAPGLASPPATNLELQTLYRAHFVSTVLSLNYYPASGHSADQPYAPSRVVRPDLICFALLLLANGAVAQVKGGYTRGSGAAKPAWWAKDWVDARLKAEAASLKGSWHQSAAWLLGLTEWALLLENWPVWPEVIYDPEFD